MDAVGTDAVNALVHGRAGADAVAPVQQNGPLIFDLVENDCETDEAEYDANGRAVSDVLLGGWAARGA